jgi:hypothetical protein
MLREAAAQDNAEACYQLCEHHRSWDRGDLDQVKKLYKAVEAAELDEPGAMAALIELKLSANAQFQDRPAACKLIETAVSRGDQSMAQRLADCGAN